MPVGSISVGACCCYEGSESEAAVTAGAVSSPQVVGDVAAPPALPLGAIVLYAVCLRAGEDCWGIQVAPTCLSDALPSAASQLPHELLLYMSPGSDCKK